MKTIMVELEVVGDPDDGIIVCKTGTIDGNGNDRLAYIDEELALTCPKCGKNQQILGCRGCGWQNL